ncbi:MAG: hypothetical protein ACI9KE_005765 [Polyangiales bacterium]|jgi:hypothetical protein
MKRVAQTCCVLLFAVTFFGSNAYADDDDGLYGRFDHGLVFALGAGGSISTSGEVRAEGELRMRVLDAAGPTLSISGAPDGQTFVVAGIELRPLFPALFLLDAWSGNERLDVFIQSIGIDLGAVFFPGSGGVAFAYGFSLELPLALSHPGPFDGLGLRIAARRIAPSNAFVPMPEGQSAHFSVMATLSLHLGVRFPASFREPAGYRPR